MKNRLSGKILLAAAAALVAWAGTAGGQTHTYTINSSPEGIVTTTSGTIEHSGTLSSPQPAISSGDWRFSRWLVDGTAALSPAGPARVVARTTVDHDGLTMTAVYLPSAQDSDSDTIPDWQEWRDFGTLGYSTASNPDGDAFVTSIERARGYPPSIPDTCTEGGVFRSSSVTMRYHNPANYYRYVVTSDPPGLVGEFGDVTPGTVYTSQNLTAEVQGYTFTHWTIDGVRQNGPDSAARTQVIKAINHDDTQFVAHYVATSADTDADGIKDWIELRYFGDLSEDTSTDGDGDTFSNGTELARGYSLSIKDEMTEGGVFRTSSASLSYHDPTKFVFYEMKSDPVGLLYQSGMVTTGTTITTPNLTGETQGYMLGYWTVDGTAQTTANGLARTQLTVTLDHDYMQIVAHYITTTLDSDSDGIRDWIEYRNFGNLDKTTADDPDGDAFSIGAEQTRGYSFVVPDLMEEGGVFRSASASVKYRNPAVYKFYLIGTDPSGLFLETNVVLPGTEITTSNQYGPLQSYTFGYWTVNSVRQASVNGIARTRLTLTVNQDLNIIGHYLLTGEDTDGDGIPDWQEWFYFGSLAYNQLSNPDGDGYDIAWEMAHGLNVAVADIPVEGGVFRSASRTVTVFNPAVYVSYVIHSEPEGLLAREEGLVEPGETVQTPLLHGSTQGYTFAYWTVNGVRQAGPSGRALDKVSTTVTEPTEIVAHYFADNEDTDGDTLKDAFEWMEFGDLDETPDSDPDGDGWTVGRELALGFAPRIADVMTEGGVFRSASKSVTMQLAAYNVYHQLTVTIDPPNGGSVHGGGKWKQGVIATLEATVPPGVNGMFSHWTGDITGSDNPAQILMEGPHSVTAHFTIAAYSLKYAAGSHGKLSGSASQAVPPGADGSPVEAEPDPGYHFVEWSDGVTQNPRTDTNVNAPVDVAAGFAINVYTVTFDPGLHGTRTGGGELSQQIEHGSAATAPQITPNAHWSFTGWDAAFNNVTGAMTVTAQYERITHTISVAADPVAGGVVSGGGVHNEGDDATVTAVRSAGWKFLRWTEGGLLVSGSAAYTFEVTGPRSLAAHFEPFAIGIDPESADKNLDAQSYQIAVTCNGAWSVSESLAWAGVAPTSGTGNGTVTVTLSENNNALSRSGTIGFACAETGSVAHAITQHGGEIELSQSHAAFSMKGGTGSVGVITSHYGLAWTAASNDAWLHVTTGATGSGNGSVGYTVDAYDGAAPRKGTITIGGHTFTVMQDTKAPNGQLVVHLSGSGTISGATPEVPVTKPVGKPVTITAKPLAGQRFAGWTGSGFAFPQGGETALKLTFVMGENVGLTARFEADPYADGKLAGNFAGLAVGADGSDLPTNGLCSLKMASTGAFTCSVLTAGGKYGGKGLLTSGSEARLLVQIKGREPVHIGMIIDAASGTANIEARLAGEIGPVLWTAVARKLFVAPKGTAYAGAGTFTALLRPAEDPGEFGVGYATVAVAANGAVRVAGKLPDGSALSGGAGVNIGDEWALFLPLYKNGGFVSGYVAMNAPLGTGGMTGQPHWVKKPVAATVKDIYYRAGFDMDVDFDAEKYAPPASGTPAMNVPLQQNNVSFEASGGGLLTDPLARLVTLDAANKFAAPVDAAKLGLKLNAKTGVFTATFIHDVSLKAVTGTGVLLQGSNSGEGVFLGPAKAGSVLIKPAP